MKPLATLLLLAPLALGTAVVSAAEVNEEDIVRRGEAAFAQLREPSFLRAWSARRFVSERDADEAIAAGERALNEVEAALADARRYCGKKFLVNACIDDARKLSFERQREIRRVVVAAQEYKRDLRTESIEKRRAEAAAEPSREPMKIEPKTVKEPAEPMKVSPKRVKPAPEPMEVTPKRVKEPSAPTALTPKAVKPVKVPPPLPRSSTAEAATERAEQTADEAASEQAARLAQEAANEQGYAEKQEKAAARQREAQARAEKRRQEREAKQQAFEKNLAERAAAQERYEERRKKNESGLAKFFQ